MASLGQITMRTLDPKPSQVLTVFTKSGSPIYITLDGGATGSFISKNCAEKNQFKIWPNNQTAGLADNQTCVQSLGYIEETFFRDKWSVIFKALVVKNLKADIYGGQPFMIENDIIQRPAKNQITIHGKYTILQTNAKISTVLPNSAALITVANMCLNKNVVYPGQDIDVHLPPSIVTSKVSVQPRIENKHKSWPPPQILENDQGMITIKNDTTEPIIIGKDVHVFSIQECTEKDKDDIIHTPHTATNSVIHQEDPVNQLNSQLDECSTPLTQIQKNLLKNIHSEFNDVFNGQLTGYNNEFGKHIVTLQWADDSRPKTTKAYSPKWSSSTDKLLQEKIDQLTEMGVLTDPYEHDIQIKCIHPCFLQKKARAGSKPLDQCNVNEVRFLSAANAVNEKCRQVQANIPDQTEIFRFVSNTPCIIYADLYESFFQNHLHKKEWGFMAINSPYKGLRVYTRSTQGLINQDEELNQLLSKVLGNLIMKGQCMKIADDLLIGGQNIDEAIVNWKLVLKQLSKANLKLSPGKVRLFPKETTIFGWLVKDGKITPDPHRKLALSKTNYADIKKITDLRSWMGVYKTFLIAMPGLAGYMDPFDKFVAGVKDNKADIIWTNDLIQAFNTAKERAGDSIKYLTLPRRDEQLILMPDATVKNAAVGFTLNIIRNEKLLPVIFYSFKLTDQQKDWFPCERECLGLATAVKKCSHYIIESTKPTLVLTDSKPVVEAAKLIKQGKFSASSRMSSFLCSISRYKIDVQHISGKFKNNIAADYLSRNPARCNQDSCNVCKFIKETAVLAANYVSLDNVDTPLGSTDTWKKLQMEDFACSEAYKRLKSGQQPSKRGQNSNDIRRYYSVCQAKNLLVVEDNIPSTTQVKHRIVVPKHLIPTVITHLHYEENKHLSSYQLEKAFNRHFFGIHVKDAIKDTLKSCTLCQANKDVPKKSEFQSVSNPESPGCIFNADIIRRHQQKILVCTDLFSSYTSACFVNDEKAETLTKALIMLVTPLRNQNQVLIRTDSATGFKAIQNNQSLTKLNIKIETTDPSNKNSIATVDNAIKLLEKEIVKNAPNSTAINETVLAMACKNLNAMIRNRGLSAHEIMFSRDDATNKNLHLSDNQLAEKQLGIKQYNNSLHSKTSNSENYNQGDLIAVNSEKNKHNARDVYYIDKVFPNKLQVNKIIRFHSSNPRLQTRHRIVQKNDVFSVKPNHTTMITKDSPSPSFEPKPAKSHPQPWCAFPQYSNIDDIDDDDKGSPKDPYEALKRWETQQRQYAKRSLSYDICSPKPVNNQPQHKETLVSESTQGDWDHQFDTHSPTYIDTDDDDFQDVFENIEYTLTPMSRVQSVDQLYEDNNLNVNTNQCQNLEHVLPKPKPAKKRVSPPRQLLPMEQEDLQHGILTRSMQSNVRLTSSNDNATPTSSKEKVERRRNAQ
jgi:hypothetical protein